MFGFVAVATEFDASFEVVLRDLAKYWGGFPSELAKWHPPSFPHGFTSVGPSLRRPCCP